MRFAIPSRKSFAAGANSVIKQAFCLPAIRFPIEHHLGRERLSGAGQRGTAGHQTRNQRLNPAVTLWLLVRRAVASRVATGMYFLALWGLIACTGCRSARWDCYPIGLFGVKNTNDLELVAAAGFNVVTGPATRSWLDNARAAGLGVLAFPGVTAGPQFDREKGAKVLQAFDRHRAVWGWYLSDEPDLHRIDPVHVAEACRWWKQAGATKPVAITVYHGATAAHYGVEADVVFVDRYPVPWQPLAGFSQQLQLARLAIGPKKKLVGVVQAFDWSYHTDAISAPGPFRPPTYDELRCMTYCALVQGADGLFYYTFDDGRWRMREHLGTWRDLHAVVSEVNARQALFAGKRKWWPKQHTYANPSDGFNEALDSSIISALLVVKRGQGDCPGGEYLVAVNTTSRTIEYVINSPWRGLLYVPVFGEQRVIGVVNDRLRDVFGPYAVRVYGPVRFDR